MINKNRQSKIQVFEDERRFLFYLEVLAKGCRVRQIRNADPTSVFYGYDRPDGQTHIIGWSYFPFEKNSMAFLGSVEEMVAARDIPPKSGLAEALRRMKSVNKYNIGLT